MKPVFRCDYCDKIGTEEEMKAHEAECSKNFNNKGCLTCKHCKMDTLATMTCVYGKEIPEGKQWLHCARHEKGEPEVIGTAKVLADLFGGLGK